MPRSAVSGSRETEAWVKGLAGGVVYRTTKVQSLKHSKVGMNDFYSILGRVPG